MSSLEWFTSSHSGSDGGNCVEVATCTDTIHVRDSKDPEGPALAFTREAWGSFAAFAAEFEV